MKTLLGEKDIEVGGIYKVRYTWGEEYHNGIGKLHPDFEKLKSVSIIMDSGAVTLQNIEEVLFIERIY